jgi:hypothetical protein
MNMLLDPSKLFKRSTEQTCLMHHDEGAQACTSKDQRLSPLYYSMTLVCVYFDTCFKRSWTTCGLVQHDGVHVRTKLSRQSHLSVCLSGAHAAYMSVSYFVGPSQCLNANPQLGHLRSPESEGRSRHSVSRRTPGMASACRREPMVE